MRLWVCPECRTTCVDHAATGEGWWCVHPSPLGSKDYVLMERRPFFPLPLLDQTKPWKGYR